VSSKPIADGICDLVNLWMEWNGQHELAISGNNSVSVERCEEIVLDRYKVREVIDYGFEQHRKHD